MTGYAPLQISTYSWSVDNDATVKVFKSYTHTSGLGKKYLHSRTDKEQQTYPFFTVKKGTITVKCDITFAAPPEGVKYAAGMSPFTAESWPVDSARPELTKGDVTSGYVALWPSPATPTGFIFGPNPPTQNGQDWSGVTYTIPSPFAQAGQGCFVQLITANRNMYRYAPPNHYTHFTYQTAASLDTAYPYPFGTGLWNLPGSGQFIDSPAVSWDWDPGDGGGHDWYSASANDSFQVWAMFQPPSQDGQPTTWIPMARYTWSWNGSASKVGGQWALASSGSNVVKPDEFFEHPEWNTFSPSPFNLHGVP